MLGTVMQVLGNVGARFLGSRFCGRNRTEILQY